MSGVESRPRVLVLGGLGMLGHKLCQILAPEMDVWATVRRDAAVLGSTGILDVGRILEEVDAQLGASDRLTREVNTHDN